MAVPEMPYKDSPAVKPLGGPSPSPVPTGAEPGVDADHEAKLDASDRAVASATSGDAAGFMDAMSDFVRICMRKYS